MAYKGILFKKGSLAAIDTAIQWGIYVEDSPYIPIPQQAKNILSQKWFDQQGDDEFIPEVIYYEPIEATIKFLYKGYVSDAKINIKSFIDYITGTIFSFYDKYSMIGRQNCRLLKFSDSAHLEYTGKEEVINGIFQQPCIAKFEITIKINDPVNNITL